MKRWGFIFLLTLFVTNIVGAEVEQEIIPAIKLEESAVIDGLLNEEVWKKAFHNVRVYIDEQLLGPEPFLDEPTETYIYYNNEALFLGFKCYDKDIIVQHTQKKNTMDIIRGADDCVGFALVVDTERHYDMGAHYQYALNAAGAYWFRPAVGRASKVELTGEVEGATQIFAAEGYWTAEVKLYWKAVDYPKSKEPIDLLLKPGRQHKMSDRTARLAHYPKTFSGSDTRLNFCRFKGFIPPPKGVEVKVLPNVLAGWDENKFEKNLGLDLRVRPTSQTNFFATLNPDFRNVEQYIGRIDPIYGAQFLGDNRPFFQEGSQVLMLPWNFYPRRIEDIDLGLSGFGKVANISFATLSTFYRGGDHNLITRSYVDLGQHHFGGAYLGHRKTKNSIFFTDYRTAWKWGEFKADIAQTLVGSEDTGRKYWSGITLKKQGLSTDLQITAIDKGFQDDLGFQFFKGTWGPTLKVIKDGAWKEGKYSYEWWTEAVAQNKYGGAIFRRTLDTQLWYLKGRHGYFIEITGGRYEENKDILLYLMRWYNYGNYEKYFRLTYTVGQRAGKNLNQLSPSFAYQLGKLRTKVTSQFLWYDGFQKQLITNGNYELTKTLGLGSRLVWNKDGVNIYFALYRTGFKGAEFFIILGDPNAKKFQKRVVGKVVYCF